MCISSMIGDGINLKIQLSKLSRDLFDLDDESFVILGVIAKKGPLYPYIIEKSIGSSKRERIDYRLKHKLGKGFLIKKEGKDHRNTGKTVKFYHLTLKGLIASLHKTPFEENYLVKNYEALLKKSINEYHIPEIAIQSIKYNLASFMVKNVLENSKLTELTNIESSISLLNSGPSLKEVLFSDSSSEHIKILKIQHEILTRSYIIQKILNQAINEFSHKLKRNESSAERYTSIMLAKKFMMIDYIRHWNKLIEVMQFENFNKFTASELLKIESKSTKINFSAINHKANGILKKLDIKSKISDFDEKLFFEKIVLESYSRPH